MKIVLLSPLFPPDIGGAATYSKELARRLAKGGDEVTVITYGHMPEPIDDVAILTIDKRRPLLVRLFHFTKALRRVIRTADVFFVENGPSVEVPLFLTFFFSRIPFIFHIGDPAAHAHAQRHTLRKILEAIVMRRAHAVVKEKPPTRPEILPFDPYPEKQMTAYEHSWDEHMRTLKKIFAHV